MEFYKKNFVDKKNRPKQNAANNQSFIINKAKIKRNQAKQNH